jgi:hypothetical protein
MTKMILAAVMASAFLISMPVRAEEKADGAKTEKAAKKDKKKAEGKKDDKADKPGGGW